MAKTELFARHQPGDAGRRGRLPGVDEGGRKAAPVVESEIAVVVVGARERDSLLRQNPLKELEMERLVVDEHAVEIEHQSAQHEADLSGW